ncbi:MAG: glutathione peroxidase [Porticoccaceae bacterium]|nr:glutathione peroxidase [Porticoccaceae bacterium]
MSNLHDIEVNAIDGTPKKLGDYAGKVLLVVNVASKCGLTPQYEALEKLYEEKAGEGLEVLGFPCNQFAGQEPGSEADIQDFCTSNYGVRFPMFSKIDVNGESRHPLYSMMIAAQPNAEVLPDSPLKAKLGEHNLLPASDTDVMWNFEKFLIGRDGQVVGRFAPDIAPDHPLLIDAINAQLNR